MNLVEERHESWPSHKTMSVTLGMDKRGSCCPAPLAGIKISLRIRLNNGTIYKSLTAALRNIRRSIANKTTRGHTQKVVPGIYPVDVSKGVVTQTDCNIGDHRGVDRGKCNIVWRNTTLDNDSPRLAGLQNVCYISGDRERW